MPGDDSNRVAMLWAYLDESSDGRRERFCAVAGFYATETTWKRLEGDWTYLTRELVEPFHSAECECGHGQFSSWEKSKRDRLFSDVCELVKSHNLSSFGSSVSVSDYKEVFPASTDGDPYVLCAGDCMANIATATHGANMLVAPFALRPPSGVQFWVEENRDTAARVTQLYHDLKSISKWRSSYTLNGLTHLGKQSIGLQMADFLARETFKYRDNRGIRPVRKPVISLSDYVTFHNWNLPLLRILSRGTSAEMLAMFADEGMRNRNANPIPSDGSYPVP